jgi:hypothetical protein
MGRFPAGLRSQERRAPRLTGAQARFAVGELARNFWSHRDYLRSLYRAASDALPPALSDRHDEALCE